MDEAIIEPAFNASVLQDDSLSGAEGSQPATVPVPRKTKNRGTSITVFLTGREYHIMLIVNAYGWVTPMMVTQIAILHGVNWRGGGKQVYDILSRLLQLGYVQARGLADGTKRIAYGMAEPGLAYIRSHGDALLCDTNVAKDPASLAHFVNLNRAVLLIADRIPTKLWLSDFQVRSDNSVIGASGLAKDYDSVAEFITPTGLVRVGFEYERWRQSRGRYNKVVSVLATEKLLHQVLMLVESSDWLRVIMDSFRPLGNFVGFIDYETFLVEGVQTSVKYWQGDSIYEIPLERLLEHRAKTEKPPYATVHRLKLGNSPGISRK